MYQAKGLKVWTLKSTQKFVQSSSSFVHPDHEEYFFKFCELLRKSELYCLIYILWVSWTRRFARVTIQNTDCVRGS